MGSTHSDTSATAGVARDDDRILVLKVWREPAFRARITLDSPGSDHSAQTVFATTETAVLNYVRDWLSAPTTS